MKTLLMTAAAGVMALGLLGQPAFADDDHGRHEEHHDNGRHESWHREYQDWHQWHPAHYYRAYHPPAVVYGYAEPEPVYYAPAPVYYEPQPTASIRLNIR